MVKARRVGYGSSGPRAAVVLLASLMALLLLGWLGAAPALADRTVSIQPASTEVAPDQTFTLAVHVDDASRVAGVQVDISYSADLLQFVPPQRAGDLLAGQGWVIQSNQISPSVLRVVAYSPMLTELSGGSGSLLLLDFHTLAVGTSPVQFQQVILSDGTGTAIPSVGVGGSVTIAGLQRTLTVAADPAEGGTVTGGGSYAHGSTAPVSATANEGWEFVNWTGPVADPSAASTTVLMDGDKSVTAHFSQTPMYTLTLTGVGCGSAKIGEVEQALPWSGQFPNGAVVTLEALPCECWEFSEWTGDLAGLTNPVTITIDADKSVTVNFTEALDYLVGDSEPLLGDQNADGDSYDAGEFGDDDLTWPDVNAALVGWAEPEALPPAATDLFDATDAYPKDTAEVRGGDGIISWGDLITTYDRSADPGLPRPRRCARPRSAGAPPVQTPSTSPAELLVDTPILLLGNAAALPGGVAQIPVSLQLGNQAADRFGLSVKLTLASGTFSSASIVGFERASSLPDSLVVNLSDGSFAVTWLDPMAPAIGTVDLGFLLVQIPVDASSTDAWWAHLTAVGTSLDDIETAPQAQAGPDAVVTVRPYHDVAITRFNAPRRLRLGKRSVSARLVVTIGNLTSLPEQVAVILCRNGVQEGPPVMISLAGRAWQRVTLQAEITPGDIPAGTFSVQAVVPMDDNAANNIACQTVRVR